MRTQHTPAPWMVSENHLQDAENYQFSILSMSNGASSVCDVWRRNFKKVGKSKFKDKNTLHECQEAEANANRIVDCVNAMEGIDDPIKMRETWEAIKPLELDAYFKMKEQRDKLLEALKQIANTSSDAPEAMQVIAKQAIKKATE